MLETPILFIIFNRIDTTQQVFNLIKEIKPLFLYIAADGPRLEKQGENAKCIETRNIIKQIDWNCTVKTLFLNENLGPSLAPFRFIKWFFSQVDEGIILEHDCLPNKDFFIYCQELLSKYRDRRDIGIISGSNPNSVTYKNNSYFYSAYSHIWGWATWKHVIDLYTLEIKEEKKSEINYIINSLFSTFKERVYWKTIYAQIKKDEIPTWDYHLTFCLWKNQLLSIIPNKNLVGNIGFGKDAVNTTNVNSPYSNMKKYSILPLIHNEIIIQDRADELILFNTAIMNNKSIWYLYTKLLLKRVGVFNSVFKFKNKLF